MRSEQPTARDEVQLLRQEYRCCLHRFLHLQINLLRERLLLAVRQAHRALPNRAGMVRTSIVFLMLAESCSTAIQPAGSRPHESPSIAQLLNSFFMAVQDKARPYTRMFLLDAHATVCSRPRTLRASGAFCVHSCQSLRRFRS